MRTSVKTLAAVALIALAAGCTSGQSQNPPSYQSVNLSQNKLQFAVGTATYVDPADGTTVVTGLNTVATFRQPNGLSATLLNTPVITGPTGFTVPAVKAAGTDAGTNHISGSPQALTGAIATTLGQSGGVFAYGFAPENTTTSSAPNFTLYGNSNLLAHPGDPFYSPSEGGFFEFRGGPPAYPIVRNGTFPVGFNGYTQGFAFFDVPPVAGSYGLNVNVQSGNTAGGSFSATGTLTSTTGLAAITDLVFVEDGAGGGTATFTAPAGSTESIVDVVDFGPINSAPYAQPYFYSMLVAGAGAHSLALPGNLGPTGQSTTPTSSITTGDTYQVTAVAFDYPAFEAGPPGNTTQTPKITGSNGQADVSISAPNVYAYGGTAMSHHRLPMSFRLR